METKIVERVAHLNNVQKAFGTDFELHAMLKSFNYRANYGTFFFSSTQLMMGQKTLPAFEPQRLKKIRRFKIFIAVPLLVEVQYQMKKSSDYLGIHKFGFKYL